MFFDAGFLEGMALGLIVGFFLPGIFSEWGKFMIVSMGVVMILISIWLFTGWNSFTFAALAFVAGEHMGVRARKFFMVKKLQGIVAENLRNFSSKIS